MELRQQNVNEHVKQTIILNMRLRTVRDENDTASQQLLETEHILAISHM